MKEDKKRWLAQKLGLLAKNVRIAGVETWTYTNTRSMLVHIAVIAGNT